MSKKKAVFLLGLASLMALGVGCDGKSLRLSTTTLDFGDALDALVFDVYNVNPKRDAIEATLEFDERWLTLEPTRVVSAAPDSASGPFDVVAVEARLDRRALSGGPVEGQIQVKGRGLKKQSITVRAAPPYEAIELSAAALNFDDDKNALELMVTNSNSVARRLEIHAHADGDWIDVSREPLVLTGEGDSQTIIIGVKRSRLVGGYHEGRVVFEASGFTPKVVLVSAVQPYQAIMVSNTLLDFGLSTRPQLVDVWNSNPAFEAIDIITAPSHDWVQVIPVSVNSAAPVSRINPVTQQPETLFDKQPLLVTINRSKLSPGLHNASIALHSNTALIASRLVAVTVRQETDTPDTGGLIIERPAPHYSEPYLIDFAFGLSWSDGCGLVAEPAQLTVAALENDIDVTGAVSPVLHRGASRQLRAEIVMDYAFAMRERPDAMAAMEQAAAELFLPVLPEDGLVGLSVFYRDDVEPRLLTPFTVDHGHVVDRIHRIQEQDIGTFSSGARMLDALRQAALRFDRENVAQEERFILLLAGMGDTSSSETVDRVVDAANRRQVKIHAVSFLYDTYGAAMMLDLSVRTGGAYLPVSAVEELPAIMGRIIERLESNYLLRWATLERRDALITPAFTVSWADHYAKYTAEESFTPVAIAGNPLEGKLRLISAGGGDNAAALLRAEYVPRQVSRIRLLVDATLPFTVMPVPVANSGLIEHWHITLDEDEESGLSVIDLSSPDGSPLPFATFGGLVRFDFDGTPEEGEALFEVFEVDNDIPEYDAGGQFFVVLY